MMKRTRNRLSRPEKSSRRALSGEVRGAEEALAAGAVVLYQARGGRVELDVRLEHDTVWLTQAQMATLFGRDRSVVTKHLKNVFRERELDLKSNVQSLHIPSSDKPVALYSLNAIISVGYRVKSKEGTQFRIWATETLRDHLLRGYTLNEKRLRERGLDEIERAVDLLSSTLRNQSLVTEQGRAVLDVVQRYTHAWRLLLEYDEDRLASSPTIPIEPSGELTLKDARAAIGDLRSSLASRNESSDLFGRERGDQLHGILGAIEQTFGASRCIRQHRRVPRICSTSSSRIIRSPMATSASAHCCSSSICVASFTSTVRRPGSSCRSSRSKSSSSSWAAALPT